MEQQKYLVLLEKNGEVTWEISDKLYGLGLKGETFQERGTNLTVISLDAKK